MDAKPVRIAGYLFKHDKTSKVFWCVIRSGSLYVYKTTSQGHTPQLSDTDEVPVMTFPISHLSATAYVLPTANKRTPTPYALQLDCAKSGRTYTFYANHEWELERWVDGIKAEASSDNIFPVDSQQSLLPPSVEISHLRQQHRQSIDLGNRTHRASPEAIGKGDVVVEQSDSVFDSIMKEGAARTSTKPAPKRSPLLSEKKLKKTFMARALPDVVVSSQGFASDKKPSTAAGSNFSSPSLSRSSSRTSNYQDSADESSLASSVTSSPVLPRNVGRRCLAAAPVPVPASTQSSGRPDGTATAGTIRTKADWNGDQIRLDRRAKRQRSRTVATSAIERQATARSMFYVEKSNKNASSPRWDKKAGDRLTEKRHTITVLQGSPDRGGAGHRTEQIQQGGPPSSSHRHSIAPLSSLDFQIHQRKRNSKAQVTTAPPPRLQRIDAVQSDSGDTADSGSDGESARLQHQAGSPAPNSLQDSIVAEDSLTDSLSESFSSVSEDMQPVLSKLKGRFHQEFDPKKASSPSFGERSESDERKPHSNLGDRLLIRAKSMVGKRSKSAEQSAASPTTERKPMPDRQESRVPEQAGTEPDVGSRTARFDDRAQMEGWLYRRKTMKWSRVWATLDGNKTLMFFKEKRQSHNPHLKPISSFDLRFGCEVLNVSQDKNISTFDLVVKLPRDRATRAEELYSDISETNATGTAEGHAPKDRNAAMHLMCKNTRDFVYWVKAFVLANASPSQTGSDHLSGAVLTLHPIRRVDDPSAISNGGPETKQGDAHLTAGHGRLRDEGNAIPASTEAKRAEGETCTYYAGFDVLEDFHDLGAREAPEVATENAALIARPAEDVGGANGLSRSANMRPSAKFAAHASESAGSGECDGQTSLNVNKSTRFSRPALRQGPNKTELSRENTKSRESLKDAFRGKKADAPMLQASSATSNAAQCNLLFSEAPSTTANSATMGRKGSSNKAFRCGQVAGPSSSRAVAGGHKGTALRRRAASVSEIYPAAQAEVILHSQLLRLRRTASEGNILEPCCQKPYRMRMKKPVPVLTATGFNEIYGRPTGSCIGVCNAICEMKLNDNAVFHEACCDEHKAERSTSDGRSTSDDSSNSTGSRRADATAKLQQSSNSCGTATGHEAHKTGGFGTFASAFRKKSKSREQLRVKTKSGKHTVVHLPASLFANASHRGYLDRRIKKRQAERFWCVLQDSCLYCYNSPQSGVTRDALLLRGYDVVADVTNVNRNQFSFRLEQTGSPTLKFSTDNHQDFLLWIGALERDTRSVAADRNANAPLRSESPSLSVSGSSRTSLKSQDSSDESICKPWFNKSDDRFEQELVEMQKQKLLKEILAQQQQILDDQKHFSQKVQSDGSPSHLGEQQAHKTVMRRNDVIDKYERARDVEEARVTKCMTLLNRRRNSVQLKVDQLSREIGPKSGKKRRQNHQQFAAFEAKLNEMKEKLEEIDEEIRQLQAKKQNAIEKISERQELELLLAEQQENLAIMRRHDNDETAVVLNRRRHRRANSGEALTSIDELSSISDCCSSGSSDSVQEKKGVFRTMSTPRYPRSDRARDFKALSGASIDSEDFGSVRDASRSSDCAPVASSSRSSSTSSLPTVAASAERPHEEVDPALMAHIELFEQFSNLKLQKLRQHNV